MRRLIVFVLALILAGPVISGAQTQDVDEPNPTQYRDVDNGQPLQLVSYILTPVGMALEWGLMRPLHYLASQTGAAPLLSGDKGSPFFTRNDNANQVPPGTFAPNVINPTNNIQASSKTSQAPVASKGTAQGSEESIPPSGPQMSGSQPTIR
jgi:hypothetical protein